MGMSRHTPATDSINHCRRINLSRRKSCSPRGRMCKYNHIPARWALRGRLRCRAVLDTRTKRVLKATRVLGTSWPFSTICTPWLGEDHTSRSGRFGRTWRGIQPEYAQRPIDGDLTEVVEKGGSVEERRADEQREASLQCRGYINHPSSAHLRQTRPRQLPRISTRLVDFCGVALNY